MGGTGTGTPVTPVSTIAFEEFLPEVMPNVPGCPEMLALNHIRHACREFCRMTTIWRVTLNAMNVTADEHSYPLPLPVGSDLVIPHYVEYDSSPLNPLTEDQLDESVVDWRNADSSTPTNYLIYSRGVIRLYVPPSENGTDILVVRVSVKPSLNATAVGEVVYNDWLEEVASGALSRLMRMPGKEWGSPDLSVYHERIFQNGIAKARATADRHGNVRTSRHVKMQAF